MPAVVKNDSSVIIVIGRVTYVFICSVIAGAGNKVILQIGQRLTSNKELPERICNKPWDFEFDMEFKMGMILWGIGTVLYFPYARRTYRAFGYNKNLQNASNWKKVLMFVLSILGTLGLEITGVIELTELFCVPIGAISLILISVLVPIITSYANYLFFRQDLTEEENGFSYLREYVRSFFSEFKKSLRSYLLGFFKIVIGTPTLAVICFLPGFFSGKSLFGDIWSRPYRTGYCRRFFWRV